MTDAERAAFRAGAEAMRRAVLKHRANAWPEGQYSPTSENAELYRAQDHAVRKAWAEIAVMPLPQPPGDQP